MNVKATKEKILDAAIALFAQTGYKEVTVREIAKAVGIKASSLYKHYCNKEDILHGIFALFEEKMKQTSIPEDMLRMHIKSMAPKQYLDQAYMMFKQVMWTPLTMQIAKIITREQQRSESVRAFFQRELLEKPLNLMAHVLDIMVQQGKIAPIDTLAAAEEYNAFIIYLYFEHNFLRPHPSIDLIDKKMKQHNAFFTRNVLKCEGE